MEVDWFHVLGRGDGVETVLRGGALYIAILWCSGTFRGWGMGERSPVYDAK